MEWLMDRRSFLAGTAALTAASAGRAFADPADAMASVAAASAQAQASNRKLLLIFHASWCVYCRLFDMMLKDETAGAIVERHYAVLHLRALERTPEMKAQQLAGADEVFATYAPKGAGLPYMAVLDGDAKMVADSIMTNGDNFGFPVTKQELDGFEAMMKAGAPDITPKELKTLRKVCVGLMKD
jgi:thiol-disulfide isomerase/thioredoxin